MEKSWGGDSRADQRPTTGYGIFIENMLNQMGELAG